MIKNSIAKKTFLIISLLTLLCCAIIYGLVMYTLPTTYMYELEDKFKRDIDVLVDALENNPIEEQSDAILSFCTQNNASIEIFDAEGTEIVGVNARTEGSENAQFTTATLTFANNEGEYQLVTTASFTAADKSYDILVQLIPFIVGIAIVISVVGAIIFSRWYASPLVKISSISKRMAALDMTWKCETDRTDEIGILSANLNYMSEQLQKNLSELKTSNEKLEQEIIKVKKIEKQRLDFFTAVSHELKTPITIIKGELEGMILGVGDYQNHSKYLRTVLKTTSRMEKLVFEILSASKMEADDFKLQKTNVNFSDLVRKCIRQVEGLAEDKEMTFNYDIEKDVFYEGDYELLKKAISNIIGNAVFHSPEKSAITATLKGNILIVQNSGVNLNDEDIAMLFNPFYRVDKSHNSNTGGSGIGLYIVKTVFDRHNIKYKIENYSEGVQFTVEL